jgi:uncharacterized membrane protein
MGVRLLFLAGAALAGAAFAAPAHAGQVCNETSFVIEAAKAWRDDGGLTSRGWQLLAPGACAEIDAPATAQQFLYARTTMAYPDGVREWRGDQLACVAAQEDFLLPNAAAGCEARGLEARGFRELSPEERRRSVLIEHEEWGDAAADAGLQRLLRAAGHDVRLIDGVAGRNTRAMIAAFESETGQRFGDDRGALMRALHEVALERNAAAGLSVCNQSGAPIAAAVGVTRGGEPESRGWWRVEDGACGRVLGGWMEEGDAFVYAKSLADETAPLPLLGGQEAFCIAPARFRAEGRSSCEARGYESADFRVLPDIDDGSAVLVLTAADFIAPARPAETGAGAQP